MILRVPFFLDLDISKSIGRVQVQSSSADIEQDFNKICWIYDGVRDQGAQTNSVSEEPFTSPHQCSVVDEYCLLNFRRNRNFFADYVFLIPVSDCRCNFLWTTRRIEQIFVAQNMWAKKWLKTIWDYEILGFKRKLISELSLNWHNRQHF